MSKKALSKLPDCKIGNNYATKNLNPLAVITSLLKKKLGHPSSPFNSSRSLSTVSQLREKSKKYWLRNCERVKSSPIFSS